MPIKTFRFNKLVRDNIQKLMLAEDHTCQIHLIEPTHPKIIIEYFKAKIQEEACEVAYADSEQALIEELGDCLEVIHGFAQALGLTFDTIDAARKKKLEIKGGFYSHTIVKSVSLDIQHPQVPYYLSNPEKYPEIETPEALSV